MDDSNELHPTGNRPDGHASGWNISSALEYVEAKFASYDKRYEQRFDGQQKALELGFSAQKAAVDAALAAADRAVQKAELAAEKRFESVNEFRATLADQQRNLMPRAEVMVIVGALAEKVDGNQKMLVEKIDGNQKMLTEKIEGNTRIFTERADANAKLIDRMTTERMGIKGGWGYAVGVVGFVLLVLQVIGAVIMATRN